MAKLGHMKPTAVNVIDLDQSEELWNFAGIIKGYGPWVDLVRVKKLNKKYKSHIDAGHLATLLIPNTMLHEAHQYVVTQLMMSTLRNPTNIGIMFREENEYLTIMPPSFKKGEERKIAIDKSMIEKTFHYDSSPVNIVYFEAPDTKKVSYIIQWYGIFAQNVVKAGDKQQYFSSKDDMCVHVLRLLSLSDVETKNVLFDHIEENKLMTFDGVGPWDGSALDMLDLAKARVGWRLCDQRVK